MPKNAPITPFNREAPRQQETFRYSPDITPVARPVDAYAAPGRAVDVPIKGDAAVFADAVQNMSRTAREVQGIARDVADEQQEEGKQAAARGDKPTDGSKAFFRGYYQMKAVADSAEYIKELDAYQDKNWALPDEEFNKGREAIKQKYTAGMPGEYLEKFAPIDADVTGKLNLNRNNRMFEKAKEQYFTNSGKVINDLLDAGMTPEEVRPRLTQMQADGIALGLNRTQVSAGLLKVIGERAAANPDLKGHLDIFSVKEGGVAPIDNPDIAAGVRAYREKIEREEIEKENRRHLEDKRASESVKTGLMQQYSSGKMSLSALNASWRSQAHLMDAQDNAFFNSLIHSEKASLRAEANQGNETVKRNLLVRILKREDDPVSIQNDIIAAIEHRDLTAAEGASLYGSVQKKADFESNAAWTQMKEQAKVLLPFGEANTKDLPFDPVGFAMLNARDRLLQLQEENGGKKPTDKDVREIFREEIQQTSDLVKNLRNPEMFKETGPDGKPVFITDQKRRSEILHFKNYMEADPDNPGATRLSSSAATFDAFTQYKAITGNILMTADEYQNKLQLMEQTRLSQLKAGKEAPKPATEKPAAVSKAPATVGFGDPESGAAAGVAVKNMVQSLGVFGPNGNPSAYEKELEDPAWVWKEIWNSFSNQKFPAGNIH